MESKRAICAQNVSISIWELVLTPSKKTFAIFYLIWCISNFAFGPHSIYICRFSLDEIHILCTSFYFVRCTRFHLFLFHLHFLFSFSFSMIFSLFLGAIRLVALNLVQFIFSSTILNAISAIFSSFFFLFFNFLHFFPFSSFLHFFFIQPVFFYFFLLFFAEFPFKF